MHRGSLKTHSVQKKGVFMHRKRVAYHKSLFCAPNIYSVPEKGVSGTEYHSCTRKACFLHRVPLKMRRVPQEAVLRTARIFRTTGGLLRYRMPQTNAVTSCGANYRVINTLITAIRLITAMPSLRTSASWKPPGTRNNRFAEKPLQLFQKIAGTFTQFLYIYAE